MDIRKGRGVWWSLALTQGNTRAMPRELCRNVLIMCRRKRPQMEPKASHWYTNNEINVSVTHPRNCFTSFVRVCDQSPVCLYVYAHFSVLQLCADWCWNCSTHQLLFHVCRTCGSWMLCLSACSSRKSNMYLMASGRALPRWAVLKMVSNRSSTNFCNVPYRGGRGGVEHRLIIWSPNPGILSLNDVTGDHH